jgi:sugar O-acyltransferase (sialic acid O-acetyltransferase NeuD family)
MIFYGAGGHAKVVIEAWIASGGKVTAIYDDNERIKSLLGKTVQGKYPDNKLTESRLVITVGSNSVRRDISARVKHSFGQIIHPATTISPSATIAEGTVVMAGSVVQAETTIGKHVIINTRASVDHDCYVGDFAHIAPGSILCGDVRIGEGALIGAGSTILPGVSVGKWAVVGAGSVVTTNVPDFALAVGVPSKLRS